MKRIWHPFTQWEDFNAGVWRKLAKSEEEAMLQKAIVFTGNAPLYGSYMRMVTEEWPIACEHNLTDVGMNRRAWLGHAAACMAIGSPEYMTRRAWWQLTQEQRDAADLEATKAIEQWELRHELRMNPQCELQFDLSVTGTLSHRARHCISNHSLFANHQKENSIDPSEK